MHVICGRGRPKNRHHHLIINNDGTCSLLPSVHVHIDKCVVIEFTVGNRNFSNRMAAFEIASISSIHFLREVGGGFSCI